MPIEVDRVLERSKEEDYYSNLFKELDIKRFLKKPVTDVNRHIAVDMGLPDVDPTLKAPKAEPAPKLPTPPTTPPAPPMGAGAPPLPPPAGAGAPPLPKPTAPPIPFAGPSTPPTPVGGADTEKLQLLMDELKLMKAQMNELKDLGGADGLRHVIMEDVEKYYKKLKEDIVNLKELKVPERKFIDTDGAYRDHLYLMATRVLDELLPELFEDIPDYSFVASQVSRLYEDGSVADAIIKIRVTVPKDNMKYEFDVDVPVLNGLMNYPLYIQRGQKIIPLTKKEIQEELDSISYRKLDVEQPYEKKNIYNNIGENIHRKPDTQKWYDVIPNQQYKSVGLPPQTKWENQKGILK